MLSAAEFADEVNLFATEVLGSADPLRLMDRFKNRLLEDAGNSSPAAVAEHAFYSISELSDAPWGPGSQKLARVTLARLVREWLALDGRASESVQFEFFKEWIAKAEKLLVHPSIPVGSRNEGILAWKQEPFDDESLDEERVTY